jgi:uncharacterized membrane protein
MYTISMLVMAYSYSFINAKILYAHKIPVTAASICLSSLAAFGKITPEAYQYLEEKVRSNQVSVIYKKRFLLLNILILIK